MILPLFSTFLGIFENRKREGDFKKLRFVDFYYELK